MLTDPPPRRSWEGVRSALSLGLRDLNEVAWAEARGLDFDRELRSSADGDAGVGVGVCAMDGLDDPDRVG